jgi:hypothetical protein
LYRKPRNDNTTVRFVPTDFELQGLERLDWVFGEFCSDHWAITCCFDHFSLVSKDPSDVEV